MLKIKRSIVDYLHNLRESGRINVFEAAPYLVQEFGLSNKEAAEITVAYVFGEFEILENKND